MSVKLCKSSQKNHRIAVCESRESNSPIVFLRLLGEFFFLGGFCRQLLGFLAGILGLHERVGLQYTPGRRGCAMVLAYQPALRNPIPAANPPHI